MPAPGLPYCINPGGTDDKNKILNKNFLYLVPRNSVLVINLNLHHYFWYFSFFSFLYSILLPDKRIKQQNSCPKVWDLSNFRKLMPNWEVRQHLGKKWKKKRTSIYWLFRYMPGTVQTILLLFLNLSMLKSLLRR